MKKILIIAAALLIGANVFAGDAWANHTGFGWRLPTGITVTRTDSNSSAEFKMPVQTGLDVTYTGVHMASGFSVRAFMDYNLTSSNIASMENANNTLYGFNFFGALGAGWAPIRSKFLLLGVYGMFGMDLSVFPDATGNVDSNKFAAAAVSKAIGYASIFLGGNATVIWAPFGGRLSFFASATAGYNMPGAVNVQTETIAKSSILNATTTQRASDDYAVSGAFKLSQYLPS